MIPRSLSVRPLLFLALGVVACAPGDRSWNVGGDTPDPDAEGAVSAAMGPFQPPPGPEPGTQERVDLSRVGYDLGTPASPVSVIEFSDFGCGYCRRFHEASWPELRSEFVERGLVRWKYIPFSLGIFPNGMEAAIAGECAGAQGAFHPMQSLLFERQQEWRGSSSPERVFGAMAASLSLDEGRFASCLDDSGVRARVEESNRIARRVGVRGTPTFFVEGYPVQGAIPTDMFRGILTRLIEERERERTTP